MHETFKRKKAIDIYKLFLILNLGMTSCAVIAESTEEIEQKIDQTIKGACFGYIADALPEFIRRYVYENSDTCKAIRDNNYNVEEALADKGLSNLRSPAKWRKSNHDIDWTKSYVDVDIAVACESEFMCVKIREEFKGTKNPVSQNSYQNIENHCGKDYHCIEKWFDTWPRTLPPNALASADAINSASSAIGDLVRKIEQYETLLQNGALSYSDAHPKIKRMKAELLATRVRLVKAELAELSKTYTNSHPTYKSKLDELSALQSTKDNGPTIGEKEIVVKPVQKAPEPINLDSKVELKLACNAPETNTCMEVVFESQLEYEKSVSQCQTYGAKVLPGDCPEGPYCHTKRPGRSIKRHDYGSSADSIKRNCTGAGGEFYQ